MTQEDPVFMAVQEDATSFCMDWPVFESENSTESLFNGTVFVLDCNGSRISDTPLHAPSNMSADEALNRIGWARCGAWHRDGFGRQTARVIAVAARSAVLPMQRSQVEPIESLVDEATLHLA